MSYETIDEGAGLVFRFYGDVAIKEIMTANTEGWEHPNWETHRYQIWDYSNVKTMIVEEQESVVVAEDG